MKIILVGIILGMLLVFSNIHVSNSYLQYNLLVTVKPEKTMINPNDFPVIVGKVTDEASKPVSNAHVMIAFGKEYVATTTDSSGNFRYQSAIPASSGDYIINVVVTKDGYNKGLASSSYFVNMPQQVTYSKGIVGSPITTTGNYTIYLGKVTEWNLETTCFVKFGNEYKRFLKTCDLYNLAPDDFKTDVKVISVLAVIKHNSEYRLFPISGYYNALKLNDTAKSNYIISTWNNYSVPN
jgi:hypothetical protein